MSNHLRNTSGEKSNENNCPRWALSVQEIMGVIVAFFRRAKFDEASVMKLSRGLILELTFVLGGRQFYLPRSDMIEKTLRNDEIVRRYTEAAKEGRQGVVVKELAKEFRLSDIHIWRIIRDHGLGWKDRKVAEERQLEQDIWEQYKAFPPEASVGYRVARLRDKYRIGLSRVEAILRKMRRQHEGPGIDKADRDREIYQRRVQRGESTAKIAKEMGLSCSQVRKLIRKQAGEE